MWEIDLASRVVHPVKSCQAKSRSHSLTLSVLIGTILRLDQFLRTISIRNELSLAEMVPGVRGPHFVRMRAALAFGMFVWAGWVQTRVEFAGGLNVCELASLIRTVRSIAADWHAGVLEVAMGVGAIGEEATHGLGLVSGSHCR